MSRYTLTVIDASGIQDYIFGSNNLSCNIGASYLVECATRQWVKDCLPEPHNVANLDKGEFIDKQIERDELSAEVVYAGGGNTVILFAGHEQAVAFTRSLSRRILFEAPGLGIHIIHKDFDWIQNPLAQVRDEAIRDLKNQKWDAPVSVPLLGLGVTAACDFTGLPAVEVDRDKRLISAEVHAKLQAAEDAHNWITNGSDLAWQRYDIPKDFDDFGRKKGESSYIAVIHADGNNMGRRIQNIAKLYQDARSNRDYVEAMRAFSKSIRRAAMKALQQSIDLLCNAVSNKSGKKLICDEIEVKDNKLPFRPIVFGGDDVTFVCDGRLGLGLAAYYLQQFTAQKLSDGQPAYARAGVAVVKTHYPFARAYALADELCRSAKKYIKEDQKSDGMLTAMDWHFATVGPVLELQEVRKREYEVSAGKLLMRPVRLTDQQGDWRSWETFNKVIKAFKGEEWSSQRNKLMALRRALREGPETVKQFNRAYQIELPLIPGMLSMQKQGWQGGRCGYFDAIEALDFFVSLEGWEKS